MSLLASNLELTLQLYDELKSLVRGPVFRATDQEFSERSRTFNGKLIPQASLAVSPLDAEDVSRVVKFCHKHKLSPSVKAGGYGIAGWSVAGDIIIDMSLMREIDIEPPRDASDGDVDWTRLKDMPAQGSKGKARAAPAKIKIDVAAVLQSPRPGVERTSSTKRRREDDHAPLTQDPGYASPTDDTRLRNYDAASNTVAEFLRGPALPVEEGETPRQPPTNKRRLHSPEVEVPEGQIPRLEMPPIIDRQRSGESTTSTATSMSRTLSNETAVTTPSDTPETTTAPAVFAFPPAGIFSRPSGATDPFGYLSASTTGVSAPSLPSFRPFGSGPSWNATLSGPLSLPSFPPSMSLMGNIPGAFATPQPGMGGIAPPRPVHTHAYVTFGAGMRQKEIDMYTSENLLEGISGTTGAREDGLVPYHVPTSAHPVGSSIMILSGFGFLSRMYGLSIDNLVEVEMVLADGRIIIVNKEEDPELWWAVRGAGPAFGIATRYKAKAFPVPVCYAGNLIYRFHRATAPSLIKHFRDCIKGAPRELYANVLLTAGPADKDSLVVIQFCYLGTKEQGMPYLEAISSWDGERCLLNEVNEKSFLYQQDSVAQVLRGKAGRQWFLRSSLIHSLPDEVIHKTVIQFSGTPIGCTWLFELSGGAIADYEDTCLPKGQREAIWTVAALHQWDMGIDDPRCVTTAEEWMDAVIKPVSIGGPFPTFLGRHEPPSRTMACYGKNWDRLVALKRQYDPECFFRNNFWPLDKDGKPIGHLHNEPPSPDM